MGNDQLATIFNEAMEELQRRPQDLQPFIQMLKDLESQIDGFKYHIESPGGRITGL